MKAVVTGVGWANGAGMGCGRDMPFSVGCDETLPKISRKDIFHKPFPHFGRMDGYSKLGIAAMALALKDAGLNEWEETRNIAVIASTVHGCLNADVDYFDTVMEEGGRLASPNLFAYTLPNTYLGEAAIHFGFTGASFVVNESTLAGASGLNIAMENIAKGEYETVITGICDAGSLPFLEMRDHVIPGALFFVIQRASVARSLSYGELTQRGMGVVYFEDKKVEDLNNLASMCTEGIHAKKE
ncbi:MAG: beta-ketoacyl synthase [Syntrophus sp. (in: bacteria)]|nr:beta-ketoacyl synthase [Syntrophus sp. (in: bacteria)]